MRCLIHRAIASSLALAASAGPCLAGPLSPPVGPVAPTPGPEPRIAINATNTPGDNDATPSTFKITQPGSYYLAGNLTGQPGKVGIEIASGGVTIDLNGFELLAATGSSTGIFCSFNVRGIVIRNGIIRGWEVRGIELKASTNGSSPSAAVIERVSVVDLSEVAIEVGDNTRIDTVTIEGTSSGIAAGSGATIRDCEVRVASTGISVEGGSTVTGCNVRGGDTGLTVGGRGGVVRDCVVSEVALGIAVAGGVGNEGALIEGCVVSSFSNIGIKAIGLGAARVDGNTVNGDPAMTPSVGIWVGDMVQVTNNVVRNVRESGGTASGILIAGAIGRANVRGNTVVNCDKGIKSNAGGNAVYSNELTQNTKHFELAAGNRVGPISTGALSPQIDGSTGGSGMGSTDPTSNFIY